MSDSPKNLRREHDLDDVKASTELAEKTLAGKATNAERQRVSKPGSSTSPQLERAVEASPESGQPHIDPVTVNHAASHCRYVSSMCFAANVWAACATGLDVAVCLSEELSTLAGSWRHEGFRQQRPSWS